ncbi:conserved Plasmodium protein, unknown function [Plasmodium malariae]|uniref:Uncharacterized protein n=1 Tax=Plasmodium malariae TaxID=5858 RepID=A0A1C3L3J0_PLAMA|nr:conserved Plasmodium protein, unknown function [Plasmodium malariae]
MNKQIISLIINGKLAEKKNMNKYIIKNNLEKVILNFNLYSKIVSKNELLKNIILYTKIVHLKYFHLDYLYKYVIGPLLKQRDLDLPLLPNIIHTYKKNDKCNYILKEINNYIVDNLRKRKLYVQDDLNNWVSILQVLSSKKKNINFVPLLKYFFIKNEVKYEEGNINNIIAQNRRRNISMDCSFCDYNKCYHNRRVLTLQDNDIDYKTFELLSPRSFGILFNTLAKVKIQCNNDFFLNTFFYQKTKQMLPSFNNIDLCLIVDAFYTFQFTNKNLLKYIEEEILKRITAFDLLQLSIIFYNLSKFWNDGDIKNELFAVLFMKKVKKYLNLHLLYNLDEKYILYTKNKKSLIEILPMFFLAYVKKVHALFPYYFSFSKFLMLQFLFLNKHILFLKKNCFFKNYHHRQGKLYKYDTDDQPNFSYTLSNINRTISNLIYSFIGYFYNILTLPYKKEHNILFVRHFFLTLNNIYQLLYFFNLFYHNRLTITKDEKFIIPLHKSQLLIFLYTYLNFILNDSFYFVKLKYIKKIFFLLTILENVDLNTIMKESLEGNSKYVSLIYEDIQNIINNSNTYSHNISIYFNRQIIGPYTISVLCR